MSEKESKKPALESAEDNTKITMTAAELKAMIVDSQKETAKLIADALIESKKPFIDPRVAENEAMFRKSSRELEERKRQMIIADQASCEHFQGSNQLSEKTGDLTAIAWHRYDDNVIRGICTNCLRLFVPTDPDYVSQFRRKSGNRISSAGRRDYLTPQVPQAAPVSTAKEPTVAPETVAQ